MLKRLVIIAVFCKRELLSFLTTCQIFKEDLYGKKLIMRKTAFKSIGWSAKSNLLNKNSCYVLMILLNVKVQSEADLML